MPVGRVTGHRGAAGELTVRVGGGDAEIWDGIERVWIRRTPGDERLFEVEHSRTYRDRLVLKLRGIDDGNAAASLKGGSVEAEEGDAPPLPEGSYHRAALVGLLVREKGREIGRVEDVVPTAGVDLLAVRREPDGGEVLIPMAREILLEIDMDRGIVEVELPEGLLELGSEDTGQ